ncbi:ATP11 protein-domain-containing protein [Lactarius quietus]|nr:ATP11 protein-domain-containing protein [Lactarius quietus]
MLQPLRPFLTRFTLSAHQRAWRRGLTDYAAKYSEKLGKVAQRNGTNVEELRARLREQEREQARQRALAAEARAAEQPKQGTAQSTSTSSAARPHHPPVRKDSSPIKPLSSILNFERLLATPHTAEQVSALWTAFHASRSGGTGRGFICASLPRDTYDSMLGVAQRFPKFVIPVPREMTADDTDKGNSKKAYEFYVLQWDFYDAPPPPSASADLFAPKVPQGDKSQNSRLATAIFTPLVEYKLRQTFATPYLVLTFYPDLSHSHDLVLLRGEVTPTAAKEPSAGDYLLSQQDAQLLTHGLQRFYLWGSSEEREKLLADFHERPGEFKWEDLLKHGDLGV